MVSKGNPFTWVKLVNGLFAAAVTTLGGLVNPVPELKPTPIKWIPVGFGLFVQSLAAIWHDWSLTTSTSTKASATTCVELDIKDTLVLQTSPLQIIPLLLYVIVPRPWRTSLIPALKYSGDKTVPVEPVSIPNSTTLPLPTLAKIVGTEAVIIAPLAYGRYTVFKPSYKPDHGVKAWGARLPPPLLLPPPPPPHATKAITRMDANKLRNRRICIEFWLMMWDRDAY